MLKRWSQLSTVLSMELYIRAEILAKKQKSIMKPKHLDQAFIRMCKDIKFHKTKLNYKLQQHGIGKIDIPKEVK